LVQPGFDAIMLREEFAFAFPTGERGCNPAN
jgi:hypothetical protein